MISWRKIPRYVVQDLILRRKGIVLAICVIPVLFVLGALLNNVVRSVSNVQHFILSLRFEFLHNPLFILLIGMNRKQSDWTMIRRYSRRSGIAVYEICSILIQAFLFTLVVFLSGVLIFNIYLYQPLSLSFLLVFASLFYLVVVLIGLIHISVETGSTKMIASIVMISLVVIDRFTLAVIPSILYGYSSMPIPAIIVLLLVIVLISIFIVNQMNGKDYYNKDESH